MADTFVSLNETLSALHTAVTRIRSNAQDLDRECEKLEADVVEKRAMAAEDRRLASHIERAATMLGNFDAEPER